MPLRILPIDDLRGRIVHDRHTIRVAQLTGSLQASDNVDRILLDGRARRKSTTIRGSERWHEVLLPLLPAARALQVAPSECREALVFQVGACNLRCWFCFVDSYLLAGDSRHSSLLQVDEIIDLLEGEFPARILHVSGGEPLLAPEFIEELRARTNASGAATAPYLWIETNLTILPRDLSAGALAAVARLADQSSVGFVGCFRSIVPEEYRHTIGNLENSWQDQFAAASALRDRGADFFATVILAIHDLTGLRGKIEYFCDTVVKHLGRAMLERIVPIEVRPYAATKARLGSERQRLLESQYEVLPVWWDILSEYLGRPAFDVLPVRAKQREASPPAASEDLLSTGESGRWKR